MDVDTLLRTKLDERCTSMQQAFRKVDVSNNGVITAADFEGVLRSFGLRITRQGLTALMDKYDHNADGFVSYEEFSNTISGKIQATSSAPVSARTAAGRTEETLRRILYASETSIASAFLAMDRDRNGFCDPSEIAAVFKAANVPLSETELSALINKFDANGDGRIDFRELSSMLSNGPRFDGHGERGPAPPTKKARR